MDSVEVPTGLAPPSKLPPPPMTPTTGRVTPGESVASSVKLRCEMGRSVTCLPVMRSPRTLVSVSASGASAVTVTVPPLTPPAVSVTSMGWRLAVSSLTSSTIDWLKPLASTVTR